MNLQRLNPVTKELEPGTPEEACNNQIAFDVVGAYEVSTVHGMIVGGYKFETIVFKGTSSAGVLIRRYDTYAHAMAGHADLVAKYKAKEA